MKQSGVVNRSHAQKCSLQVESYQGRYTQSSGRSTGQGSEELLNTVKNGINVEVFRQRDKDVPGLLISEHFLLTQSQLLR